MLFDSLCPNCFFKFRPGCHNNTCGLMAVNPITSLTTMGELAQDVLSIHSTGGSNPGSLVMRPRFLLTCAPSLLLHTVFPGNVLGVIFFGDTPYDIHPGIDISCPISYTPLIISPLGEY
ncbi:hypothetical protein V6N13_014519 [Hibiscus sabdariffa]|uniref:Uncharacterized protein n=2 Tax=Hibiscus sabdariffa TaxID=183260 RepID=A0ABR1ZMU5_9ROSI